MNFAIENNVKNNSDITVKGYLVSSKHTLFPAAVKSNPLLCKIITNDSKYEPAGLISPKTIHYVFIAVLWNEEDAPNVLIKIPFALLFLYQLYTYDMLPNKMMYFQFVKVKV